MKTAIYGLSGFGDTHYRLMMRAYKDGLLKPEAALVINPAEVPHKIAELESVGCRIYSSSRELWKNEKQIDFCMIPTSISSHAPYVREAIEQGANVFVEKPFTSTIDDALDLCRIAKEKNRRIFVGFQDIYSPDVQRVKRMIMDGEFGRILSIRGMGSWPRPQSYFLRNSWAGCLKSNEGWVLDSPMNNAMAHFLMIMLFWGGKSFKSIVTPTHLQGDMFRVQDIESFDTASLRLKTEEDCEVFYAVTHSAETLTHPFIRIEGTDGWLEWRHFKDFNWKGRRGGGASIQSELGVVYDGMINAMFAELKSPGSGVVVTAEMASVHTKIVNALHESGPILPYPNGETLIRDNNNNPFRYVDGLHDTLVAAFRSGRLISEVLSGKVSSEIDSFKMTQYCRFSGETLAV